MQRDWQRTFFLAKQHVMETAQDQWFDRTRHVHTSGDVSLLSAGIAADSLNDSELYVPARPAHVRAALRSAPIADASHYTYVDLGSGKGRTLFLAAELPFRRILGVEFSSLLHAQACSNIGAFHGGTRIHSLHMDATNFIFPPEPLVLYMFNPFGRRTMQTVLDHLQESLAAHPRHVVVVLLWPRCEDQVLAIPGMHRVAATREHQIFEVHPPGRDQTAG